MTIEQHKGVHVLRDDLLPGGTKSVLLSQILDKTKDYFVYASPVYGGMQIALAHYCSSIGKQAVIFCAERKEQHPNTIKARQAGAIIYQVPYGYLTNCQHKAKVYTESNNAQLINFGANYPEAVFSLAARMQRASAVMGGEPDQIFCAVGSGTLLKGIIKGTKKANIIGVQVGAQVGFDIPDRVKVLKYHKSFEQESKFPCPFQSCSNYDLKAWEYCLKYKGEGKTFFWNVL